MKAIPATWALGSSAPLPNHGTGWVEIAPLSSVDLFAKFRSAEELRELGTYLAGLNLPHQSFHFMLDGRWHVLIRATTGAALAKAGRPDLLATFSEFSA